MAFFNKNDPQDRALAEAYVNRTYDQLPPALVAAKYQAFLQNVPEKDLLQIHDNAFERISQPERVALFHGLVQTISEMAGINAFSVVPSTTPEMASPPELGMLFRDALKKGIFGDKGDQRPTYPQGPQVGNSEVKQRDPFSVLFGIGDMARTAIAGLLGYEANRALNNAPEEKPAKRNYVPQTSNAEGTAEDQPV